MKRFVVISSSEPTRRDVVAQLEEIFGESVEVESCTVAQGIPGKIRDALVLISSALTFDECRSSLDKTCEVVIANRTLNYAHLDKLYSVPENSSLLIVNDAQQTTDEVIELLKMIGFSRYRYHPYYPGCPVPTDSIDYVITPGEVDLIPGKYPNVIDIGPRILDITTIIEIAKLLKMFNAKISEKSYLISA